MSWGEHALSKASCFAGSALSDILTFLGTTFSLYSPLFSFSVWEGDRMCGWSMVYNSLTHCSYIFPLQLHRTASSKYVLPLACSALPFFFCICKLEGYETLMNCLHVFLQLFHWNIPMNEWQLWGKKYMLIYAAFGISEILLPEFFSRSFVSMLRVGNVGKASFA